MSRTPLVKRITALWSDLGGEAGDVDSLTVRGEGALPSVFATSDLATASISCAALALEKWRRAQGAAQSAITVDHRLSSYWFGFSFKAVDWTPPPLWDALAGDYRGRNGWIRLHTNAPHHRAAALSILGPAESREELTPRVSAWDIHSLESEIINAGGCAAAMRSMAEWAAHPTGAAIIREDIASMELHAPVSPWPVPARADRPLAGLRVLDLTRILAGPIGTRFLAGYGAEVLRIDPPGWDEGATIPEVTPGKRCTRLDLKSAAGRETFLALLAQADVLVHGYRPDALDALGLGDDIRRNAAPQVVDVALDAYGWHTPWAGRRGFDSLVQMSCGIADAGMTHLGTDAPKPLPVQALDHATGYLIAAAALRGLTIRAETSRPSTHRLSLARTAQLLMDWQIAPLGPAFTPLTNDDYAPATELMDWGTSLRLKPPVEIPGVPMTWNTPARKLGTSPATWLA